MTCCVVEEEDEDEEYEPAEELHVPPEFVIVSDISSASLPRQI